MKKFEILSAGLAIFAMFFGAGNIIFPLALGLHALDQTPWALMGLILTAVIMPFAGLIAMFRYQGSITLFFGRLGRIPGLLIATIAIALLGPFGASPRCLALAHATLALYYPQIPLILFSAIAILLVFFFTYRQRRLLHWLGSILSPLMILLLIGIMIRGLVEAPVEKLFSQEPLALSHFWHGLTEGYNTMDLLAAFFFAPLILFTLDKKEPRFVFKAASIGAFLLASTYIGFCYLAFRYASQLEGVPHDQLLGMIAMKILGPYAGEIVSLTVLLACLTTAIALIAAFVNFVHKEICKEKVSTKVILPLTLLVTFLITTLEFKGIAQFLTPLLTICYPLLILLTVYNLCIPLKKIRNSPYAK